MHFWTAPGPELIRVYAYLASWGFPSASRMRWNGLSYADVPMVRSSPSSESAQLRRIGLHATGLLRSPVKRGPSAAFHGIEFAGVHQRSGEFSCPQNSHEHPRICGRPFCACRPFIVGWAGRHGQRAEHPPCVAAGTGRPAANPEAWRWPGPEARGAPDRRRARPLRAGGWPGHGRRSGGELRTGERRARSAEAFRMPAVPDGASGSAWSVDPVRGAPSRPTGTDSGPWPAAGTGQDLDS